VVLPTHLSTAATQFNIILALSMGTFLVYLAGPLQSVVVGKTVMQTTLHRKSKKIGLHLKASRAQGSADCIGYASIMHRLRK
jgi:hypothetical protein